MVEGLESVPCHEHRLLHCWNETISLLWSFVSGSPLSFCSYWFHTGHYNNQYLHIEPTTIAKMQHRNRTELSLSCQQWCTYYATGSKHVCVAGTLTVPHVCSSKHMALWTLLYLHGTNAKNKKRIHHLNKSLLWWMKSWEKWSWKLRKVEKWQHLVHIKSLVCHSAVADQTEHLHNLIMRKLCYFYTTFLFRVYVWSLWHLSFATLMLQIFLI